MVVLGLVAVIVISVIVARLGLAYLDGAKAVRRPTTTPAHPTIDLTDSTTSAHEPPAPEWAARGFDLDAATSWIHHGFDPDHAFLLHSLEIDPSTAARLRAAGLEDSALLALVEEASFAHHDSRAQLVLLAEQAPQLAPQALAWLRLGASTEQALTYAREGFTPAASDTWRAAGWHLDDAVPWFTARFEPTPALTWRDNGFTAAEAEAWRREHFGLRQAIEWRRLGDTPAQARHVERRFADARVTVTQGLQWLDLGFSLDETQRWLDAGVRNARAAARVRARGYGPDDLEYAAPLTRDDLLSAARQIADARGSSDLRHRVQAAAEVPREVSSDLIDDVLDELQRLGDAGSLGAPAATRALVRRLERGLLTAAQTAAPSTS